MTYEEDTADDLADLRDEQNRRIVITRHDRRTKAPRGQFYAVDFAGYIEDDDGLNPAAGFIKHVALISLWCEPDTGNPGKVCDAALRALQAASRHRSITIISVPVVNDYSASGAQDEGGAADGVYGRLVPVRIEVAQA